MTRYFQPPPLPNQERAATLSFLVALGFLVMGCSGPDATPTTSEPSWSWDLAQDRVQSLKRISYVDGERVLLLTEDGERDFVVGVNLGATIPGHGPGEVAIRAEDYRRWFPQMSGLGFNAVRIFCQPSLQTNDPCRRLYLPSAATDSCCVFGRVKLKVLPSPRLLFTQIRPPWASTIPMAMLNPSPLPAPRSWELTGR